MADLAHLTDDITFAIDLLERGLGRTGSSVTSAARPQGTLRSASAVRDPSCWRPRVGPRIAGCSLLFASWSRTAWPTSSVSMRRWLRAAGVGAKTDDEWIDGGVSPRPTSSNASTSQPAPAPPEPQASATPRRPAPARRARCRSAAPGARGTPPPAPARRACASTRAPARCRG